MYVDQYKMLPELVSEDLPVDVFPADPKILTLLGQSNPYIYRETDKLTLLVNSESFTHIDDYQEILSKKKNVMCLVNETVDIPGVDWMYYPSWLFSTVRVNRNVSVDNNKPKRFLADVLLGGATHNRKEMFDAIKNAGLIDRCLVNLCKRQYNWYGANQVVDNYRSPELDKLDHVRFEEAFEDNHWFAMLSMTELPGQINYLAQRMAAKIYENSYISVVTETENRHNKNFFTEKTYKPLIARRPMLLYSNAGSLAHLRSIGFKTFAPWIDESYDALEGARRIKAIVKELIKFNNSNKDQMLKEMQEIFDHNAAVANDNESWKRKLVAHIKTKVNP